MKVLGALVISQYKRIHGNKKAIKVLRLSLVLSPRCGGSTLNKVRFLTYSANEWVRENIEVRRENED